MSRCCIMVICFVGLLKDRSVMCSYMEMVLLNGMVFGWSFLLLMGIYEFLERLGLVC